MRTGKLAALLRDCKERVFSVYSRTRDVSEKAKLYPET